MARLANAINRMLAKFNIVISRKSSYYALAQKESPYSMLGSHFQILNKYHNLEETMTTGIPKAADGSPVPWYTFPAIEYFTQLDVRGLNIFEYGSGQSSLYWARKGANVYSVENDKDWFDTVTTNSSVLQGLMFREDKEAYVNAISESSRGGGFDIIIIDGIWRTHCTRKALDYISPTGVFILDNSDWYTDSSEILANNGYIEISFSGFGPINGYTWTTSLFIPHGKSVLDGRIAPPVPLGGIGVQRHDKW